MSDSDAEFEKFLQESLSSSAASSYLSKLSRSRGSGGGTSGWWQGNEEAPSDQELEATAQSWLKSTGLQSGVLKQSVGGASLQVTLPSAAASKMDDYSKDSLEVSGGKKSERGSKSEDDDFQDTFSVSGSGRSSTLTDYYTSTHPGLDTLEENADKLKFFTVLEQGRDTPLDYHKLNLQLDNTGRSSAVNQESGVEDIQNYDYQDDFDSSSKDTHSQSTSTSVTPTNSHTNIQRDQEAMDKDGREFTPSPLHSATSLLSNQSDNDMRLNASMTTAHSRDKHQHSSLDSHKTHIRVGQRALARLPPAPADLGESLTEPKGFSLSPIHSQVLTKPSVELSTSGHSIASSSSEPDRKVRGVSLTPIHSTSTTHIKDTHHHHSRGEDGGLLLKRETPVLSPLHQRDISIMTTAPVNPDRYHSSTQLSPVRNKSGTITVQDERDHSPTRSGIFRAAPTTIQQSTPPPPMTPQQRPSNRSQHPGNIAIVQQPNSSSASSKVTTSHHGVDDVLLAKSNIETCSAVKKDDKAVNIEDTSDVLTAQSLLTHNQSGLAGDLAELQNALQAAGLPGIETDSRNGEAGSSPSKHHPPPEGSLTEIQPVFESVGNHQSSSLHSGGETQQVVVQRGAGSEREMSTQHQPLGGVGHVNLKEAIRAIASEEITLMSKELLQRDKQMKQPSSTTNNHHLSTTSDVNQPTHSNTNSAATTHRAPGSQGLEEFDRLMADISDAPKQLEVQTSDEPRISLKDTSDKQNRKRVNKSSTQSIKKKPFQSRVIAKPAAKVTPQGKKQTNSSRPLPASSQKKQPLKSQAKENRHPTALRTKTGPLKSSSVAKKPTLSERSLTSGGHNKKTIQPAGGGGLMKKDRENRSLHLHVTVPSSETPPTGDSPCSLSNSNSNSDSQDESHQVNEKQLTNVLQSEKLLKLEQVNSQVLMLSAQLEQTERQAQEKEELLRAEHDRQQKQLKQELFEMNIKLKDLETSQDPRKMLASGRSSTALITKEEKSALQRDIKEQEVLLQGYQKENERLYSQLTQFQKEAKATQSRLFEENQRFAAELLNARSQLERQSHQLAAVLSHSPTVAFTTDKNLDGIRIAQLEEKLDDGETKRKELQNQVKQLTHTTHCLNRELHSLKQDRAHLETKMRSMVEWERLEDVKTKHKIEVEALNKKIEWFTENQKLLDHDCELLKSRESEIIQMKEKVLSLQQEAQTRQKEVGRNRGADARKIQQLEKHVKELETIIQKRFPNSLSALILTSNTPQATDAAPSGHGDSKQGGMKKPAPPSREYLERRVQQLEQTLEGRDKECSKKLRAMQQKCTTMELAYEKQIAFLKQQKSVTNQPAKSTHAEIEPLSVVRVSPSESVKHGMGSSGGGVVLEGGAELKLQLDMKAVKQENCQLKEKLSELSFELAHEHIQLQGKLAEAENKTAAVREEMKTKLKQCEDEHSAQWDTLIAKFAREHSQSEVTKLHSQLASQEATIVHLKEKIECMKFETDQLAAFKSREETLNKQLRLVSEQLLEAKRHLSPEMHHFMALQAKITSLEERCASYETKISEMQFLRQTPTEQQMKEIEQRWRLEVHAKNAEIEHFREELDSLLSALQILQKQGVTPSPSQQVETRT